MSDLAKDLIKDSYRQIASNRRQLRLILAVVFLVYVILYLPLVHLTQEGERIQGDLTALTEDKVALGGLGEEFRRVNATIDRLAGEILTSFVARLRQDFKCLDQAIRSAHELGPDELKELAGEWTVECRFPLPAHPAFRQLAEQQQQQQQLKQLYPPSPLVGGADPDFLLTPSFPADELASLFDEQMAPRSEDEQRQFVESALVQPRLEDLNAAWRDQAVPAVDHILLAIGTKLKDVAVREGDSAAAYRQLAADLEKARADMLAFDFAGSLDTGSRPWWRSVEGKEGYKRVELDRVDQVFRPPQAVDTALARLSVVETAWKGQLEDVDKKIVEFSEQLKVTANLLGADVGAGSYVSLPILSIAPTLPLVLGVLFAGFLAESSEQSRQFAVQLQAYARLSDEDIPVLRSIVSQHPKATILMGALAAGAWVLHATYEAYRLVPESLATTAFSAGAGLVLLLMAVFYGMRCSGGPKG